MRTLVAVLLALLAAPDAEACTSFLLSRGEQVVVAKSYDWSMGQGLVVINKRGVHKRALVLDPRDTPAEWTSRHASVTFNQYGVGLPNGGMNDAGLVVEVMWLAASKPTPRDARPAVNELEWIQYQLDNHASVAEMIAAAQDVRVSVAYGKVHYLACDRAGACAVFEHLDGALTVVHGDDLPVPVLANEPYLDSLRAAGTGRRLPGTSSAARFARAAAMIATPGGGALERRALEILESVRIPDRTRWHLVYDPTSLRAYFRTTEARARSEREPSLDPPPGGAAGWPEGPGPRKTAELRHVDLSAFDGACSAPVILDIDAPGEGDVSAAFTTFTVAANRTLVERSTKPLARALPAGAVARLAEHPQTQRCQGSGRISGDASHAPAR